MVREPMLLLTALKTGDLHLSDPDPAATAGPE